MLKLIKFNWMPALLMIAAIAGCEKPDYSFGEIKTPTGLSLSAIVVGTDAANPNGNGSGSVTITAAATGALTYNIDFGDGRGAQVIPSGKITYKYAAPGTNNFTISVNAIGTGGAMSTISKKVTVFVAFQIPANILSAMTNGSSKVWVTDKAAPGHVGVGPNDAFSPIWYAADPNTRDACQYDDEITFAKDANGNITMAINNKGQSFSIGAASAFYGFGGGDNCFNIDVSGTKKLVFMDATTSSTSAVSTRIQFMVPGNGMINFGTGGNTYEILSISNTQIHLRNIGIDGNAWYQKLSAK